MVTHNYQELISVGNLFQAWNEFRKGKRKRKDVQVFERNLEDNLFGLHQALKEKTYKHGQYQSFYVHDPKQRHIHKASVQDRIVHHLLYKYLYELFDKTFIFDSYSCRLEKGTHKAVNRLEKFTRIISKNYTRGCWALKLDVKKFFASVDHEILLRLLELKINDEDILWLLKEIMNSFCICHLWIPHQVRDDNGCKGIPLGNLTSQVFANIYLNELDKYVKHALKIKYYLRYADDFLILLDYNHYDRLEYHSKLIDQIRVFLRASLKLELHPKKIIFRNLNWGIDFLGYIILPHYILSRTKTKKRIFRKLKENTGKKNFEQSLQSYLGYLRHSNSYGVKQELKNLFWISS